MRSRAVLDACGFAGDLGKGGGQRRPAANDKALWQDDAPRRRIERGQCRMGEEGGALVHGARIGRGDDDIVRAFLNQRLQRDEAAGLAGQPPAVIAEAGDRKQFAGQRVAAGDIAAPLIDDRGRMLSDIGGGGRGLARRLDPVDKRRAALRHGR